MTHSRSDLSGRQIKYFYDKNPDFRQRFPPSQIQK